MSLCVRMEYVRVQEDVMWFNELVQKIPLKRENADNNVWLFVTHVKFFFSLRKLSGVGYTVEQELLEFQVEKAFGG